MATVDKNFRIKHGLVVEGTTGTINGQNILTETGSDTYILNLVGGATLVKSVNGTYFSVDNAGNLNFKYSDLKSSLTTDGFALVSDITDAISTLGGQTSSDIADAISTAEGYTDTAISSEVTNRNNAISSAISTEVTNRNNAISTAKSEAITAAEGYTDTAVANLVDGAPALLDTLNELAAAIADNPNYATDVANLVATKADTTYVDSEISGVDTAAQGYASTAEQNAKNYADGLAGNYDAYGAASTAQANAENYANTVAGTAESNAKNYADGLASNYDPAGAAATAQGNAENYADTVAGTAESNAKSYADGLASNYDPAGSASTAYTNALNDANGYTDGYIGAVLDGTEPFTEINLNSITSQRAVQTNLSSIATGASVMSWAKSDYPTAKLWVKFATATHSQISEVLLTADAANNIAITEFGIVGTNGNLGAVTAVYNSGNIGVQVDTVYANTEVTVSATLIK
jgi:hypothetical protein